jgi:hypothetical protein
MVIKHQQIFIFFPGFLIPPACFGEVTILPDERVVLPVGLFGAGERVTGDEINVYNYGFREKIIL